MKQIKASILILSAMGIAACQPGNEEQQVTEPTQAEVTQPVEAEVAPEPQAQPTQSSDQLAEQSYAFGVSLGSIVNQATQQYLSAGIALEQGKLLTGFEQQLAGQTDFDRETANALLQELEQTAMARIQAAQSEEASEEAAPLTEEQSAKIPQQSYALGMSLGAIVERAQEQYATANITLEQDKIVAGITDEVAGSASIDAQQAQQLLQTLQMNALAALEKQAKAESAAFLAENAARPEVTVTESGLQYEVLAEGDGESPTAADRVQVHYRGTLIDGTEFDSSYNAGKPISFALNGVIRGWTEGLQLMKTGAKYRFVIPSELAYGAQQKGPLIKPHSTLVFEVELLDVIKPEEAQESEGK